MIRELGDRFPTVQFYDYTKRLDLLEDIPANYHLTYSWSGENEQECLAVLAKGINVAVPFYRGRPATFLGYPVIDGDANDLRFLDPEGVIVALKFKVPRQPNRRGFPVKALNPRSPFVVFAS